MMEENDIKLRTERFHSDVINSTIESLRQPFADNGLSEDLLDRLKASWEKHLHEN